MVLLGICILEYFAAGVSEHLSISMLLSRNVLTRLMHTCPFAAAQPA